METVITVILSVLLLVLFFLVTLQFRRAEKAEQIANIFADNMQEISDYIQNSKELIESDRIATAFSGDDEIGTFFENLKHIQEILNQFVIEDVQKSK